MYSGSQASSKNMSLLFSSSFKHSEADLQKNRGVFDSDLSLHHHQNHPHQVHQQQQQQQQLNSGLMRYQSAPSTLLANFVDGVGEGDVCGEFLHPRSSSPEAESMFARFMSCAGNGDSASADLREIGDKSPAAAVNQSNSHFMASIEHDSKVTPQQNGYPPSSKMVFHTVSPPPLPNHSSASNTAMESSYNIVNSSAIDHSPAVKTAGANCSNLIRHSSSPAGLFSHLTVENGYPVMRGMGNFRAGNGSNGESAPSTSRFKGQMNFSSGPPTSSGRVSQISEIGSESISAGSPDDGSLGNSSGGNRCYIPGFPIGSWDDTSLISESYSGSKRPRESDEKIFSGLHSSETLNGEAGNRPPPLAHHFSLPKTSAEIAAMEKFLQFQHSVPCKIRAKRGCATHPRSIAERVRRTRISERMRKLQELVPNMDKQTNTADMLDLAVEYIKELQKQVKKLTDNRANCSCSSKQKSHSNPAV